MAAAMPRLTSRLYTTSWAASSHHELISGVRRIARQTALATTSSGETLTSRKSRCALSFSTSFMVRVTSTVTHSVTCGAVKAESTMACAIILRTPLIGSRGLPLAGCQRSSRPVTPVVDTGGRTAGGRLDVVAGDRAVRAGRGQRARGRRRGPWPACGPAASPARVRRRRAAGSGARRVAGTAGSSACDHVGGLPRALAERALQLQLRGAPASVAGLAPPRRARRWTAPRSGL